MATVANNTTSCDCHKAPPAQPEPQAEEGPKFCANCGKPLEPGAKFCKECGHPVQGA